MAEVIQFNCPVCAMTLRLPLAMAGQQGPCPGCQREIVAPDPYRGVGARPAEAPPPPREPEPFKPFAETPPLVPREQEAPVKLPEPVLQRPVRALEDAPPQMPAPIPTAPRLAAPSQRPAWILACLLSGLGGLAIGYALGGRSVKTPPPLQPISQSENPAPVTPQPVAPIQVAPKPDAPVPQPTVEDPPPKPDPEPSVAEPVVEPVVEEPKVTPPEPAKISAAAEASLRAFLEAPDWASRSAHVLTPETVRNAMEAYSHVVPDGPTPFKSLVVNDSHIDPKTGSTLFIFFVVTDKFPQGMPVAIKETSAGWLVDWPAFVEFRDNLFEKFVGGPEDKSGVFHLIVTRPAADRAANTENANFSSVLLQSPLSTTRHLAFVKKNSELFETLQTATDAGRLFSPVLEVAKRKTVGGQPYFEVMKITATDWFPRETAADR